MRWIPGTVLGMAAGLAAVACGPSFQAVYEGDVRFEHCYALDQGPASADVKKECWQGWLHDYTYGQSRDRVEYAGTRFSELSLDPSLPTEDREVKRPHMHAVYQLADVLLKSARMSGTGGKSRRLIR